MAKTMDLPNELMTETLSWLPVKSLLRFKSVCKHWHGLIQRHDFMANHYERSKTYILTRPNRSEKISIHQGYTLSLLCSETLDVVVRKLEVSPFVALFLKQMHAPWNGIVFLELSYLGKDMVLWNPATRELKILPKSHILRPFNSAVCSHEFGYGYDPKTDDYKVVRIDNILNRDNCIIYLELYSLRRDSWTKIDHVIPAHLTPKYPMRPLYLNGMCCFLASVSGGRLVIMSFDFSNDTLTPTLLPDCYKQVRVKYMTEWKYFFVLNDCIALINRPDDGCFEIWVLNEVGNKDSWTRMFKFGPCSDLKLPLGNLKDDELFLKSKSGELLCCCPVDPIAKHLQQAGTDFNPEAFEYKESLFRIDRKYLS